MASHRAHVSERYDSGEPIALPFSCWHVLAAQNAYHCTAGVVRACTLVQNKRLEPGPCVPTL